MLKVPLMSLALQRVPVTPAIVTVAVDPVTRLLLEVVTVTVVALRVRLEILNTFVLLNSVTGEHESSLFVSKFVSVNCGGVFIAPDVNWNCARSVRLVLLAGELAKHAISSP